MGVPATANTASLRTCDVRLPRHLRGGEYKIVEGLPIDAFSQGASTRPGRARRRAGRRQAPAVMPGCRPLMCDRLPNKALIQRQTIFQGCRSFDGAARSSSADVEPRCATEPRQHPGPGPAGAPPRRWRHLQRRRGAHAQEPRDAAGPKLRPLFDVTLDCEDGAPVGGEAEHAQLCAELAHFGPTAGRVGARGASGRPPGVRGDVDTLVGPRRQPAWPFLMVPKPRGP